MKKVLLGCGILVLVLGIAGAFGAYYFVWKPAKAVAVEFAKLKEIPKLNQQVRNTTKFAAPADNVLNNEGVQRFLRTQQAIQTQLGARAEELAAKYKLMEKNFGPNGRPSWTDLTTAYQDFAGLLLEAKRAQVDALNQNSFSVAEYEWTRQRIYEAAEIPVNLDFEKVITQIAEGKMTNSRKEADSTVERPAPVPEQNRTLVNPYKKELTERAVMAAFGL